MCVIIVVTLFPFCGATTHGSQTFCVILFCLSHFGNLLCVCVCVFFFAFCHTFVCGVVFGKIALIHHRQTSLQSLESGTSDVSNLGMLESCWYNLWFRLSDWYDEIDKTSKFCYRWSYFRMWLRRNIVNSKWFENGVLLIIILNCIFITLDNPTNPGLKNLFCFCFCFCFVLFCFVLLYPCV